MSFSRRQIVFGLALSSLVSGCSKELTFSSREGLESSLKAMMSMFEDRHAGLGKMYGLAVYRALNPVTFTAPEDDFDPLKIIPVVTDRPGAPAFDSKEYYDVIFAKGAKIDGLSPEGIVALYFDQDTSALNDEALWANGFDRRSAARQTSSSFDVKRRQELLSRVTPRSAGYRWTYNQPRVPFVDFSVFNPLDRDITGIDFLIDLVTATGKIVASTPLAFKFDVALGSGVESKYSINVSSFPPLDNRTFMDLRDPLQVSMRVKDVYIGNGQSIVGGIKDDSKDGDRSKLVSRLFDAVNNAKLNLFKYRVAFS